MLHSGFYVSSYHIMKVQCGFCVQRACHVSASHLFWFMLFFSFPVFTVLPCLSLFLSVYAVRDFDTGLLKNYIVKKYFIVIVQLV